MNVEKIIKVHSGEGELAQDMLTFNRLGWYVLGSKRAAYGGHIIQMIYIGREAETQQLQRINELRGRNL